MPCAFMMRHGVLRHGLMREEIEFEGLAQRFIIDAADRALPGRAGIRHDDVDAAECLRRHAVEGARTSVAFVTSQASASAVPPISRAIARRRIAIAVEHRDFRACARHRFRRRRTNARTAAGDDGDLSRQRLLRRLAELGLFQRPVFDIEHVGFGDRLIAAHRFGIGDHLDRVLRDVGGDRRVLGRRAQSEQAMPGTSTTRGQGSSSVFFGSARALLRAK